jgi:hypothetical protein
MRTKLRLRWRVSSSYVGGRGAVYSAAEAERRRRFVPISHCRDIARAQVVETTIPRSCRNSPVRAEIDNPR